MGNHYKNKKLSEGKIIELLKFIYGDNPHHVVFFAPFDVVKLVDAIKNCGHIYDDTSIADCMDRLFYVDREPNEVHRRLLDWRHIYFTGDNEVKTTFTKWDEYNDSLDALIEFIRYGLQSYTNMTNIERSIVPVVNQPQPENIKELINTFNEFLDSEECDKELEKLNNKNNINTIMTNKEEQKMKYKFEDIPIGTTVHIKDLDWYNNNKLIDSDEEGYVSLDKFDFTESMSKYCGMIAKIVSIKNGCLKCFTIDVDNGDYYWTEDMFDVIAFPEFDSVSDSMYSNESITIKNINNEPYEMVNHPSHYNSSSVETIEKMIRIWGYEKTAIWCEMTAFKYRDRIGNKPGNSLEQEMGKIKWYEAKANELYNKLKSDR